MEIQFCCKNGEFKPVESSQSIIGNKQIFTLVDLSERKKAEAALLKSEERFKLAMETANVGLWDADLVSGIAHYNEHYFKMLGYDRGEFEADHEKWIENIHPDDRKRVKANADKLTKGKTEHSEIEFRMKASNGNVRHILSIGKITGRDEKNKPTRVTGIHLDITERAKNT
ncbi:MAG: PAS domain-containing protein [Candidatus Aminicenantes bacterium]|nr:PAS domain-containing protein [Candidatus Aminicenantes bacterium]NIQ70270.1 PAS domain-containing protein [Candidatus Aminicenantes bacterium]NIT26301.1 PAS domain-containing protein [Candidatus Aminicenantes bacterium]